MKKILSYCSAVVLAFVAMPSGAADGDKPRSGQGEFSAPACFTGYESYIINGKKLSSYSAAFQNAFTQLRSTHRVSATLHSKPELVIEAFPPGVKKGADHYGVWLERGYLVHLPEKGVAALPAKVTIEILEPARLEALKKSWKGE